MTGGAETATRTITPRRVRIARTFYLSDGPGLSHIAGYSLPGDALVARLRSPQRLAEDADKSARTHAIRIERWVVDRQIQTDRET